MSVVKSIRFSCLRCNSEFFPHKAAQRFCSIACANYSRQRRSIEHRFWQFVCKTDACWSWTGHVLRGGYGQFRCKIGNAVETLAHRVSWILKFGEIPDNLCVLHDCDRLYGIGDVSYRKCVNPAHLFLGTYSDNARDMHSKKRNRNCNGEHSNLSVLTNEDVAKIRLLYSSGQLRQEDIAKMFGVTRSTISYVVLRKSWKHLP